MTAPRVAKASRRGLADEAADRVREAILTGRIPPGAPLSEVELAAELDISRGSVREGLAQLEKEGLTRGGWHRRTRVIDVTPEDVEEVYQLRMALDRLAATAARRAATPAALAELDDLVTTLEAQVAAGADSGALAAADLACHDQIYRMAGNSRLTAAWRAIRSQIHLFHLHRVSDATDDYRARGAAEHRTLAGLLRGDDEAALARYAEQHVDTARRTLLAALRAPA